MVFLLLFSSFAQGAPLYLDLPAEPSLNRPIAIVGDTQRTMLVERILLREQNDEERPIIVKAIAAEQPGLLTVIGDLVAMGGSESDWDYFDELMTPIRKAAIPVLPAVGNHEYFKSKRVDGIPFLAERFPQIKKSRWYSRHYGALGMIWLDSNKKKLEGEWEEQSKWFAKELERMEADPQVQAVVVFTHHPPFSNSLIPDTGDNKPVQETFVPAYLRSKKARIFFSAHAHGYQRFHEKGKHFIVTAGGGGARFPMASEKRRKHKDFFNGETVRPFNFTLLSLEGGKLKVVVKGMEKGETKVRVIDSLVVEAGKP